MVVVIGGLGSFGGAVVGGLIVGELSSLTTLFAPAWSQAAIYAAMTLVLVSGRAACSARPAASGRWHAAALQTMALRDRRCGLVDRVAVRVCLGVRVG